MSLRLSMVGTAVLTAALASAVTLVSASALAADPTKQQCLTANGSAQNLRRDGKLSEAREQLRMCSNPRCPSLVSADCTKRLDELEGVQPTLVFEFTDAMGHDVTGVKVAIDGKPLLEKLDGAAVQVNPGEHVFTFTASDLPTVTRTLVVREGEKRRQVIIETPRGDKAEAKTEPKKDTGASSAHVDVDAAPPVLHSSPMKTVGLVTAGVGVVGLAVGSAFGLMTMSQANLQKEKCPTGNNCDRTAAQSANDAAKSDGTISTVAFVAGGALVTGGLILFFTAKPSQEEPPTTAKVRVVPGASRDGAGVLVSGVF